MNVTLSEFRAGLTLEKRKRNKRKSDEYTEYRKWLFNKTVQQRKGLR